MGYATEFVGNLNRKLSMKEEITDLALGFENSLNYMKVVASEDTDSEISSESDNKKGRRMVLRRTLKNAAAITQISKVMGAQGRSNTRRQSVLLQPGRMRVSNPSIFSHNPSIYSVAEVED